MKKTMKPEAEASLRRLSAALLQAGHAYAWSTVETELQTNFVQILKSGECPGTQNLLVLDEIKLRQSFAEEDLATLEEFFESLDPITRQMFKPEAYKLLGKTCPELEIERALSEQV